MMFSRYETVDEVFDTTIYGKVPPLNEKKSCQIETGDLFEMTGLMSDDYQRD